MVCNSGVLSGNEIPYVVYALDTPKYPNLQGKYGQTCAEVEQEGSCIIISGGYFEPGSEVEHPEIFDYGCLDMWNRTGNRFAERTISAMIAPDDRVTMLLYISRMQAYEWLSTIRGTGFEVIETGDVTPGYDSNFAVCVGKGAMLASYEWLAEVWGYDIFCLLASKGDKGRLETELVNAGRAKTDPDEIMVALTREVDQHPELVKDVLGEQHLFVWLTDPDQRSLQIVRSDQDVSHVGSIFSNVARELGIALYYAGSLREVDSNGCRFSDFSDWDTWRPIPKHWKQIEVFRDLSGAEAERKSRNEPG